MLHSPPRPVKPARPGLPVASRNRLVALVVVALHAAAAGWLMRVRAPVQAPLPAMQLVSIAAPEEPQRSAPPPPAPRTVQAKARTAPAGKAPAPPSAPAAVQAPSSPAPAAASPATQQEARSPADGSTAAAATVSAGSAAGSGHATPAASPAAAARIDPPTGGVGYLDNPRPDYPALSRRLGEQGRVVLRVQVEIDGHASRAEIRVSSGYDRLDRAALQAALRWRYQPGRRGGSPEPMSADVPVQFVLE